MKINKTQIENMRILGMTFLNLFEAEPLSVVNMRSTDFNQCGTPACHAGWFAVSLGKEKRYDHSYIGYGVHYTFSNAVKDLSEFLGFASARALELWAGAHPELWGNGNGEHLFASAVAFDYSNYSLTLQDIGMHWLKVADRCEKAL